MGASPSTVSCADSKVPPSAVHLTSSSSSSVFDGAAYYVTKNTLRYTSSSLSSLSFNTTNGPLTRPDGNLLYAVGNNWVQQSACAKSIHAGSTTPCKFSRTSTNNTCLMQPAGTTAATTTCLNSTDDSREINYGFCNTSTSCSSTSQPSFVSANASPSTCSDSSLFATKIVSNLAFTNDQSALTFATCTLRVKAGFSSTVQSAAQTIEVGPSPAWTSQYIVGQGKMYNPVSLMEEDKTFKTYVAAQNAYTYGESSKPSSFSSTLQASDGVRFAYGVHPQQVANCVYRGCSSCDFGVVASFEQDLTNTCLLSAIACHDMTINPSRMTKAAVYRPWTMYWYVVLGQTDAAALASQATICEFNDTEASGESGSCCLFNGTVTKNPKPSDSHFAYEPSPYVKPSSIDGQGPVLGVPLTFALHHSAQSNQPASTSSFLAQFLQTTCSSSDASTYKSQCSWLALQGFYTRLTTMLSSEVEATGGTTLGLADYTNFATMYWTYAVSQIFCLGFFQLAQLKSLDNTSSAPIALFMSKSEWSVNIASIWSGLITTTTAGATASSQLAGSAMFTDYSRPVVSAMNQDTMTLRVLVPALLFPWLSDLNKVATLVQRMFPVTVQGSSGLNYDSFEVEYSAAEAFDLITNLGDDIDTSQVVFNVSAAEVTSYFVLTTQSPSTPYLSTSSAPAAGADSVNIAASVSISLKPLNQSVTCLFYLYCLQQLGPSGLPGDASLYIASRDVQPVLVPDDLTWSTACQVLESQTCSLPSGYSQTNAYRINQMLLTLDSSTCKCLTNVNLPVSYTASADGVNVDESARQAWNPGAICFNAFCTSTATSYVAQAALVAAAAAGSYCPLQSAAAEVVINASGSVTAVNIVDAGLGYDTEAPVPLVVFFGGSATTPASATAVLDANGSVSAVTISQAGAGYTSAPTVRFLAQPRATNISATSEVQSTATVCPVYCDSYVDIVQQGGVSLDNVNLTNVLSFCDVDPFALINQSTSPLLGLSTVRIASIILMMAPPVVYFAALAAAASQRMQAKNKNSAFKFSDQLAGRGTFVAALVVAQIVCVAAFVYAYFDLEGEQKCQTVVFPDDDGYSYPSSKCMSKGYFQEYVPFLASYELPQAFCKEEQLYCECNNNELIACATSSTCGCSTSQCCSANGLCAAEQLTDDPASNRPLTARLQANASWFETSIDTIMLCVSAAAIAAPLAAVAASSLIKRYSFAKNTEVPWWSHLCCFAVALLVCALAAVPVVQAWMSPVSAQVYELGVGECTSLSAYPDQVVASLASGASGSETSYVFDKDSSASEDTSTLPVYTRTTSESDLFPWSRLWYSTDDQAWVMTSDDNSSTLYNNQQSSVLYQGSSTEPTLHAVFQDVALTLQNTVVLCGTLGESSSCSS